MRRISTHLSYANVTATLALALAMTGGAIAATGGFTSGGRLQACVGNGGTLKLIKGSQKCHRGQQRVVWNQTGPQGPAGPSGLAGQSGTSPTIPGKVSSAETALTANNALSLGGIPASEFTRRDCASLTGQIKGFAMIQSGPEFPSEFVTIPSTYNCSGGAVEARRLTTGRYEVKFVGNPAALAFATVDGFGTSLPPAAFASVSLQTNGLWEVRIWDAPVGNEEDLPFSLILP
jgi:hypothetical protein